MALLNVDTIIQKLLNGDKNALARIITLLENQHSDTHKILQKIYSKVGNAYRIGITGPPGAGKSTLTDKLAMEARKTGFSVGVVAVDPTSPFTGGAILGDRIRMTASALDKDIFIRSMATRGSLGGIARTTRYVADAMDASGKDIIFIETVGVGQSELDIFFAVDTVIVVVVPESGSGVQAMKAGLMEIAHCFVVNKADRPGADLIQQEIEDMLQLAPPQKWEVKVLLTQAHKGGGMKELFMEIERHREFLKKDGLKERRGLQNQHTLKTTVLELLQAKIFESSEKLTNLANHLAEEITEKRLDPISAANRILSAYTSSITA